MAPEMIGAGRKEDYSNFTTNSEWLVLREHSAALVIHAAPFVWRVDLEINKLAAQLPSSLRTVE